MTETTGARHFNGVGQVEAKFQVEGLHFSPIDIHRPLDRGMATLLQFCRWKFTHKENV